MIAFLSMVDRRKSAHRAAIENLPTFEPEVVGVIVPHSVVVERMGYERTALGVSAPKSEPARAYAALWTHVADEIGPLPRARDKK